VTYEKKEKVFNLALIPCDKPKEKKEISPNLQPLSLLREALCVFYF